jgi:NADH dehydrogenase [ubiquinone] 1 alpha subcomplex assembly factor 7
MAAHLRQRIAREGPLTIAAFMEEALVHPRFGYYTTRDPLGVAGDFTTAPEISQMFGELVGAWCAVAWQALGSPDPVSLIELGPGRGTLMTDLLRATRSVPGFAAAVRLHLVEISPALRARQQATLATVPLGAPPVWHRSLASVPEGPLLLVANEFFDALPIRQFQKTEGAWRERLVDTTASGKFRFVLSAPLSSDAPIPPILRRAPEDAIVEVCPPALDLADAIATRIFRDRGAALIIDYGHADSAVGDTLQAVKGHAYRSVLDRPGEADLTAHVDFAALAHAARAAGAHVLGPVSQGAFLERLGIGPRARALAPKAAPEPAAEVAAGCQRLTDPEAMGALFKVMAITAPNTAIHEGFEG